MDDLEAKTALIEALLQCEQYVAYRAGKGDEIAAELIEECELAREALR